MSIPDDPFSNDDLSPPRFNFEPESFSSPHESPERQGSPSGDPSPSSHSNAHSTPGGSLLVPGQHTGTKTPRRVQWTSDSHIVQMHQLEPIESEAAETGSPRSQTQALDENNIDQVRDALERHRSRTAQHRAYPPSMLSRTSSAGDMEEMRSATEEDYDYRLDVDPQPAQLERLPSPKEGDEEIHDILDHGANDHVAGGYIPIGETDGLPTLPDQAPQDELSAAKDIVRAHTGKWGVLRRRVKGAHAVNAALGAKRRSQTTSQDPEKTVERQGDEEEDEDRGRHHNSSSINAMPAIPNGASVLSSLLALYGQQNVPGSGATSAATSAASSRASSPASSDSEHRRESAISTGRRPSEIAPGGIPIHHVDERPSHADVLGTHHARSKSTSSLMDRMEHPDEEQGFWAAMRRAKRQFEERERPKSARSGAGVFGALIQNTTNLSGVATPSGATLAPAARRHGYQLNRFSLPNPDGPDLSHPWRPETELRPSRPSSRHDSRPGSVHSSTAVSDSPRDDELKQSVSTDEVSTLRRKALSTDDMLSLREKEKDKDKDKDKKRPKHFGESLGRNVSRLPGQALKMPERAFKDTGSAFKNAEKWIMSGGKTPIVGSPGEKSGDGYFPRVMTEDERRRKEWESEKKRRKKAREARKKQEIFIIQHVAALLQRQQFLLKLARALMMFGSPSHRLETQIQATAKVLEINAQVVYLPGTMLISFGDDATHTSETKFLKQATGLDLGKLLATHQVYWNVVHDKIIVDAASKDLDILMTTPVYYSWWQTLTIGGLCSAFIVVISFYGSFIDALMSIPLGTLLVAVQMLAARNDMFSNVFEIAIACLISFLAAALASTKYFCYTALVSGGVVLILPGYIVLCGALELASRNITAGAVRVGYSVIYSLFLGFGITMGVIIYQKITGLTVVGANDYTCSTTHSGMPWWGVTPSAYWYFLCCPGYSFMLSLRNQQPLFAKELPIMVLISCAGWVSNHFSALAFPNRSDLTSAIGSFVVGTLGNIYGRFSNGSSFPVTVTGILFQLPSGLANGGIFSFAAETTSSTQAYSDGFSVAEQLVSVAIGLTVGLFVSAVVTHPFGGGRKRGSGIFSF
ncbi:hypothetical protein BCR39DRAFT_535068 [Naematelia encephala]|uniref:DUF1212-domain-containing protein n=1 Tax=Naematelia encephala TaxID=71784 RepID=A0A1Y2B0Z3_9TREE|nr:hypothetical protein BCR39DRAFT_535068 [Naematelia encephala]